MATTIKYLPGYGVTYFINVKYIAETPVDDRSLCAFCHGDPCAEEAGVSMIKRFYLDCVENGFDKPETCPMCKGRCG